MSRKIAIMQPYFLPYMGYWQLINYVDEFVVYDNIKYTKKGWINRNRFLQNGKDALFSLPLQSGSDDLDVADRELSSSYERGKLIRQLQEAYKKAPFFSDHFPIIEEVINFPESNLSDYIENSIRILCHYLNIKTPIIPSSNIAIEHKSLKGKDKVIAICKTLTAEDYINPIGGLDLYDKQEFRAQGINLIFLKSLPLSYKTFNQTAIPHMSILDVLMFNGKAQTQDYLKNFELK